MKYIIPVRREHIDNGVEADCQKCAVALALSDVFPDFECYVGIYHWFAVATLRSKSETDTPDHTDILSIEVMDFIRKFDNSLTIVSELEPFEFEFEMRDD